MFKKRLVKILKWTFSIVLGISLVFTACLYLFKDQIVGLVLDEVNSKLKRPIQTKEIELTFWSTFPNLEVDMKDVYLQSAFSNSSETDTLLFSEHLYLNFSPFDIIDGNYEVKSIHFSPGSAHLHVNKNGESNYDILKKTEDNGDDFYLKLNNISFENFAISYQNDVTKQKIETELKAVDMSGNFSAKEFDLNTAGEINLKRLRNGEVTLLSNKDVDYNVSIHVNNEKESFSLSPSSINVENLPFQVEAKMDSDSLNFKIQSQNILITDMIHEFLSDEEREIKKLKGDGIIEFVLTGHGGTRKEDKTNIQCAFGIKNGTLIEPFKQTKLEKINLNGLYISSGEEENEMLAIKEFQCKSASGPFSGDIKITKFNNPKIEGKAKGKIDLGVIYSIFQPAGIEHLDGMMDINGSFDFQNNSNINASSLSDITAQIRLENTNFKLLGEKYPFKNLRAGITMNGENFIINHAKLTYGSSDMQINGSLSDVVSYFSSNKKIKSSISINSSFLNLDEYFDVQNSENNNQNDYILPKDIDGNFTINASKLIYDQHVFSQVNSKLNLEEHEINIPYFNLKNADAVWNGYVNISEPSPSRFELNGSINTSQVNTKTLFGEWHNLYQDNVTSEHIVNGTAKLDMEFKVPYDLKKEEINTDAMNATIKLTMDNSRFRNIPLFKEMTGSMKNNASKLLLGNKNIDYLDAKLSDLTIPHLENTITISNGNIIIPKMSIKSSAMNVEMTGVHGFNDIVDYRLEIYSRDLMDVERMTEFGEIEYDGNGNKLFLHISGNLENLDFSWDKKAHKEQIKQNLKEEKEEIKSMLKSEFGLFKNDTTVKKYEVKQNPKEEVKLNFGNKSKEEKKENVETVKEKKDGILKKTLKTWKAEEEEEKEATKIKIKN